MSCSVPAKIDLPAVLASARSHVDEPVGGAHHRLIVLDDEHGVAEIAQALQRADQAFVVGRMQTDRRLIADVEHAHQTRADLRCEADALRLSTGERSGRAVEREVVEADLHHEVQAGADLLQDLSCDRLFALAERRLRSGEALGPSVSIDDAHRCDRCDVLFVDSDGERLGLEPGPAARRARVRRHVALDLAADVVGVGFLVAPLEVRDDALVVRVPLVAVAA